MAAFSTASLASETAIARFHGLYDQGRLGRKIWTNATPEFCAASTKERIWRVYERSAAQTRKSCFTANEGWNVKSFNFKTTVLMQQKTTFEHGQGTESFTFAMVGTNAVLLSYNIQSMDLIIK